MLTQASERCKVFDWEICKNCSSHFAWYRIIRIKWKMYIREERWTHLAIFYGFFSADCLAGSSGCCPGASGVWRSLGYRSACSALSSRHWRHGRLEKKLFMAAGRFPFWLISFGSHASVWNWRSFIWSSAAYGALRSSGFRSGNSFLSWRSCRWCRLVHRWSLAESSAKEIWTTKENEEIHSKIIDNRK